MITKISTISPDKNYNYSFGHKKENKKKEFSDRTKFIAETLAGIATIAAAGFIITKHIENKTLKQIGEIIIERPKIFSEKTLSDIADAWYDEGVLDYGDRIVAIPKIALKSLAKEDKEYAQIYKGMKMSDNGFAVTIYKKNDDFDFERMHYYDPEAITVLRMVDALKKGAMYICEVG